MTQLLFYRIESIIYETVTLSSAALSARFLRTFDARPPAFFTAHVKSLCIPIDIKVQDAERILAVCQGVVNLAYWICLPGPPSFQIITSLRPKRLSISIGGLFGRNNSVHFGQPFFANVTHLELVDWPSMSLSSNFQLLPSLTHLAVDVDRFYDEITKRLHDILNSCRSLLVLLCLVPNDDDMIHASSFLSEINDTRLVVLSDPHFLEDWEASLINSETSQWVFAEGIAKEKAK
jgi:hypothetical protein